MTTRDPEQQPLQDANLDRALDAALAKYSAVEPRAGLEDRILARIRAVPARSPKPVWWARGLAAIAAIVVIAAVLTFRPETRSKPPIAKQTRAPVATQRARTEPQIAKHEATAMSKRPPIRPRQRNPFVIAAASLPIPKLDQFPSLQPLSEEEQILAGYIEQNPQHAALLAEANMDSLRRDAEERLRIENKDQRNAQ